MKQAVILQVNLGINATNDDLTDQMRIMKRHREDGQTTNIVCTIRGFLDDRRELFEVPEVRAFCKRLCDQGFISYLDPSTTLFQDDDVVPEVNLAWGAFEVWFCGIGRMRATADIYEKDWHEFESALLKSNGKSDSTIGPFTPKKR